MQLEKVVDAEPVVLEWVLPIIFVCKSNKRLSFRLAYRLLIAVTVQDSYSMPRISKSFSVLREVKQLSNLDANLGYWQIRVDKEGVDKTA